VLDPWNAMFTGAWYKVVVYTAFACNCVAVAYSLVRLVQVWLASELTFNLRNVVYATGLIATILTCATLLMRVNSIKSRHISNVASFLSTSAYFLLLYLWSIFMHQCQQMQRGVWVFRGMLVLGLLTSLFAMAFNAVMYSRPSNAAMNVVANILSIQLPLVQIMIGGLFLIYAIMFFRKREDVRLSRGTYNALTRLSQLALVAFLCYCSIAATNFQTIGRKLLATPGGYFGMTLLRVFGNSARNIAVLLVLGVRMPRKSSTVVSSDPTKMGETISVVSRTNSVATIANIPKMDIKKKGASLASEVLKEGARDGADLP